MKTMYRLLEEDELPLKGDFQTANGEMRKLKRDRPVPVGPNDVIFRPLFQNSEIENMGEIMEEIATYFNDSWSGFILNPINKTTGAYGTTRKFKFKPKQLKLIALEKVEAYKHCGTMRWCKLGEDWNKLEILGFSSELKAFIVQFTGELRMVKEVTLDNPEGL